MPKKKRRREEAEIQEAICSHYQARGVPGIFMLAIPNGGSRNVIEATLLKRQGVVAGVPDTLWIKNRQPYFLELKKSKGGRVSNVQSDVMEQLEECGAICEVAHGLDQALKILEDWGMLRTARADHKDCL